MSWLDGFFRSGIKGVAIGGAPLPYEGLLNFASGATGADNPSAGSVDITITGGGGGSSVTGTGVWTSTSGTLNPAAYFGTGGDQFLVTNHAGTALSWVSATGDLDVNAGAFTVVGLQGHGVPTPSAGALTYTGSAWTYTTVGSIFTPGGDLTGTGTAQYVGSLSGGNNAGGPVVLENSAYIRGANSTMILGGRNVANTADIQIAAVDSSNGVTIGDIAHASYIELETSGAVYMATDASSPDFVFKQFASGGSGSSGIWLGNTNIGAIADTNVSLAVDSSGNTYVHAPPGGQIYFGIGASFATFQVTPTALTAYPDLGANLGVSLTRWASVWSQTGVQAGTSTTGDGVDAYFTSESGMAGGHVAGVLYLDSGAASAPHANVGTIVLGPTNAKNVYIGPSGVGVTTWLAGAKIDESVSGYTTFTNPTSAGFYFNTTGAVWFVSSTGHIYMDGDLEIQDPSNGNPVWDFSSNSAVTPTITAGNSAALGMTITQAQPAGTGTQAGGQTTITAQQGQAQTGTNANTNGGILKLQGGLPGTGGSGAAGNGGLVQIFSGATQMAQFDSQNGIDLFESVYPQVDNALTFGIATQAWSNAYSYAFTSPVGATTAGFTQTTTSASAVGADMTVQPQRSSFAGSRTGGNLVVSLQAPVSGGSEVYLQTQRDGTQSTAMGAYSAGYGGWWGTVGTPTASNWAIISAGTVTQFNASSTLYFDIGGSALMQLVAGEFSSYADLGVGLGDTTHRWSKLAVQNVYIDSTGVGGGQAGAGECFTFQPQSVAAISTGGTTSCNSYQPLIICTGTINSSKTWVLDLGNNVGMWWIDISALNFGNGSGPGTLSVKSGSSTVVVYSGAGSAPTTTNLVTAHTSGSNSVSLNV